MSTRSPRVDPYDLLCRHLLSDWGIEYQFAFYFEMLSVIHRVKYLASFPERKERKKKLFKYEICEEDDSKNHQ